MTKILLVDDENLILFSLATTFKRAGAEVTAVMNGQDALAEVRRCAYDVCFLDVHLPDANGLDLMKIMRNVSPTTRIIIMTAAELSESQLSDVYKNAGHFLPKPFELDEVRTLVSRLLENGAAPALPAA